jgi:hypothetical protein
VYREDPSTDRSNVSFAQWLALQRKTEVGLGRLPEIDKSVLSLLFEFSASILVTFARGVWPLLYVSTSQHGAHFNYFKRPVSFVKVQQELSRNISRQFLDAVCQYSYQDNHSLSHTSIELLDFLLLRMSLFVMVNENRPIHCIFLPLQNFSSFLSGSHIKPTELFKHVLQFRDWSARFFASGANVDSLALTFAKLQHIEARLPGVSAAVDALTTLNIVNLVVPLHQLFSQLHLFLQLLPGQDLTVDQYDTVVWVLDLALSTTWLYPELYMWGSEPTSRLIPRLENVLNDHFRSTLPVITMENSNIVQKRVDSVNKYLKAASDLQLKSPTAVLSKRIVLWERQLQIYNYWSKEIASFRGVTTDQLIEIGVSPGGNAYALLLYACSNASQGRPWFYVDPNQFSTWLTESGKITATFFPDYHPLYTSYRAAASLKLLHSLIEAANFSLCLPLVDVALQSLDIFDLSGRQDITASDRKALVGALLDSDPNVWDVFVSICAGCKCVGRRGSFGTSTVHCQQVWFLAKRNQPHSSRDTGR